MFSPFLVLLLVRLIHCFDHFAASTYDERLLLRPLPQAALLASFNFLTRVNLASFASQNFDYFPRALGQILQHAHTKELHVRFSSGRWDVENWGQRPWGGSREGGTGVELWAWVEAANEQESVHRERLCTRIDSSYFKQGRFAMVVVNECPVRLVLRFPEFRGRNSYHSASHDLHF